jgi:hypothetical protein
VHTLKFTEKLLAKIRSGDSLTDTEVEIAANHFQALFEMLRATGPEWRMAADEAWRLYLRLDDYRRARKAARYRPNYSGELVLKKDGDYLVADKPFVGGPVVTRDFHEAALAQAALIATTRSGRKHDQQHRLLVSLKDTISKRHSEALTADARDDLVGNVLNPLIELAATLSEPVKS